MKRDEKRARMSNVHALWILAGAMMLMWVVGCEVQNSGDNTENAGLGGDGGSGGVTGIAKTDDDESLSASDGQVERYGDGATFVGAPSNAVACMTNNQCPTGYCVDGFCCDSKCDNKCMACSAAKKGGGSDGICGSIAYDTDPDNDCPFGACDGKNMCKNYNGFSCTAAAMCLSNYCVDGFCCGNICMGACQACSTAKKGSGSNGICGAIGANTDPDNECNPGECNGAGACNASPQPTSANGAACSSSAQCASGYCADGVCCDSWCLGTCQACTAAKKGQGINGVCGNIANDKDPDEECWGGACNGAGVCKQYNGVPCIDKTQCLSGYCVDGFCCGNICNQQCYACSEAKKGQGFDGVCGPAISGRDVDNECNPGECNGSGACNQPQTPQTNGTTCVSGGQCASGNCVDGVCCDTACAGLCQACTTAKKGSGANGVCGNIVAETDPDSECGVGGRCGGNGACRFYNGATCAAAAQCFSNYCVDGVCCGNVCNSACYACSAAKKGQGADGSCGPIANTRDPDNECTPGECNGSGACNQQQVLLPSGSACTLGAQCASSFCVDGVCCDTACTGSCKACTAAKKGSGVNGICGNIKYDTDPDDECSAGACSGNATCQGYNGVACTQTTQCLSNYCVDGYCCGNVCNGSCMACSAAKKGSGSNGQCGPIAINSDPDDECSLTCNGAGACLPVANGAYCATNANCASGFCVDGVCCNNACTGNCQACNMPGTAGTCTSSCTPTCPSGRAALGQPPIGPLTSLWTTTAIVVPDLDGDGIRDVVTTSDDKVRVYLRQSNGSMAAGVDYQIGSDPRAMATGDLDNDGFADIVVTDFYGAAYVLVGQGNGTFAPSASYGLGGRYTLAVDDINGDGYPDLVADAATVAGVKVLLNQGNGTFGSSASYSSQGVIRALALGDLNGDGFKDIVATGREYLEILLNQGNGAFGSSTSLYLGINDGVQSVVVRDLSGDGIVDAAIARGNDPNLGIYLGQGNATFAPVVNYGLCGDGGPMVATDVTGDGISDLVIASSNDSVSALRNLGNGTFTGIGCFPTGAGSQAIASEDMNGDGRRDLITSGNDTFNILPNLGGGNFLGAVNVPTYPTAPTPTKIMTADVNGDGKADLVTGGNADTTVSVLLGQGNGTFSANVNYPAAKLLAIADMNGDGRPDIFDVGGDGIGVLLNQGNGTFGTRTIISTTKGFANVVAELNGDGFADLAYMTYKPSVDIGPQTIEPSENKLTLAFNQGNGTFNTVANNLGGVSFTQYTPSPTALKARDLNGDGRMDLVYHVFELDYTEIRKHNNTNAGLGDSFSASGLGPFGLLVADLTGDGYPDIGTNYKFYNSSYMGVRVNTGAGTSFPGGNFFRPYFLVDTAEGDFNGDGLNDIVMPANFSIRVVSTLHYNTTNVSGAFTHSWYYATGTWPTAVVAADFNGDGRPDVATANSSTNNVSILLNSCLP